MSATAEAFISPDYPAHVQLNQQLVMRIRNIASLALGVGAGILKIESYWGFLFYIFSSILIGALILTVVAKGSPKLYFASPFQNVWLDHVLGGLASYVLCWTLFYGLVSA